MAVTRKEIINFEIDQGCDFSKTFTVTAYDISGLTITSKMRKTYESSSAAATFTTSIVSGSSGTYKLTLANSLTAGLSAGRYVYDVELTLDDTTIERVQQGIITVSPQATK
jgi:hypothetical protein